ncbi:hypothetical protein [Nostoc sp.]
MDETALALKRGATGVLKSPSSLRSLLSKRTGRNLYAAAIAAIF